MTNWKEEPQELQCRVAWSGTEKEDQDKRDVQEAGEEIRHGQPEKEVVLRCAKPGPLRKERHNQTVHEDNEDRQRQQFGKGGVIHRLR